MNTKLVATQVSLQNWMITFRDRQSSGLTIQEYCRQRGLSKNAYPELFTTLPRMWLKAT